MQTSARTREAARLALSMAAFADELDRHPYEVGPGQQEQALRSLVRLCVQARQVELLSAVPLGLDLRAQEGDPFRSLFQGPLDAQGRAYEDLAAQVETRTEVPFTSGLVWTAPWSEERYLRALLRSGPEWRDPTWTPQRNQTSILYLPWELLCVDNGNHSAMSGLLRGDGVLVAEVTMDLSPVLERVRLSAEGVVRADTGTLVGVSEHWAELALVDLGRRLGRGTA